MPLAESASHLRWKRCERYRAARIWMRSPSRVLRPGDGFVLASGASSSGPFTEEESRVYGADNGYIVERVIDRRDLDRAVKSLR